MSLLYKALAVLALVASLIAGYFAWHHHVFAQGEASMKAEWDADKQAAENQAETLRILNQGKINQIDRTSVAKAEKQAKVDRNISDKVEQNVPSTLPLLPGSFRVQHDAAAAGQEIDDSRAANAVPVAPRTVASTITRNYESARGDKERLAELQAIVRASGCFEFEGE